ncbi:SprT-like domain-containing protein [Akkermansia sp.]|uniref:SprT-like domain-containing protein n=1 Tax=Akkermansia sp. TaxID=1872421 RepID=UPI00266BE8E5|nr:SprT-like domain-containing protein [Akkermansia sp.]
MPHEVRSSILHEIAHALAWMSHGGRFHVRKWKTSCREIGAVPRAARQKATRTTIYQ